MLCIDPAMCECVWLMIVVVCECKLGEVYVCGCGCLGRWAREMFSAAIICIMD